MGARLRVFSCERKSEETAEDKLLCDRPPWSVMVFALDRIIYTAESFLPRRTVDYH